MEDLPFFVNRCKNELREGETSKLTKLIFSEGLKLKVKSFIEGQRMIDGIARQHLWEINLGLASTYLADAAVRGDNDHYEQARRNIVRLYCWVGGCKYVSSEVKSNLQRVAKTIEDY